MKTALRFAVVVGACAAIGLPWIGIVKTVENPPPPQVLKAQGIVWGGRVFVDRAALAAWLRSRGASYEAWAKNHPVDTTGATPRSVSHGAVVAARPTTGTGAASPAPRSTSSTGVPPWLVTVGWLGFCIALVLGLVAAVVRSLRRLASEPADDLASPQEDEWAQALNAAQTSSLSVRSAPSRQ